MPVVVEVVIVPRMPEAFPGPPNILAWPLSSIRQNMSLLFFKVMSFFLKGDFQRDKGTECEEGVWLSHAPSWRSCQALHDHKLDSIKQTLVASKPGKALSPGDTREEGLLPLLELSGWLLGTCFWQGVTSLQS